MLSSIKQTMNICPFKLKTRYSYVRPPQGLSLTCVYFSSMLFLLYCLLRPHIHNLIYRNETISDFSEMHPGIRERSIHGAHGSNQHVWRQRHHEILQTDLSWHIYQVNKMQQSKTTVKFFFSYVGHSGFLKNIRDSNLVGRETQP